MPIGPADVVSWRLPVSQIQEAFVFCYHVLTHLDPDQRAAHETLQPILRTLFGELAERVVLAWLWGREKSGEAAADKGANPPEVRHELWVRDVRGARVRATVHWMFLPLSADLAASLGQRALLIAPERARGIHILVGFWWDAGDQDENRPPVLIGWVSDKNLRERKNRQEGQPEPHIRVPLGDLRPMEELEKYLV